jgi:hypothetical protein
VYRHRIAAWRRRYGIAASLVELPRQRVREGSGRAGKRLANPGSQQEKKDEAGGANRILCHGESPFALEARWRETKEKFRNSLK